MAARPVRRAGFPRRLDGRRPVRALVVAGWGRARAQVRMGRAGRPIAGLAVAGHVERSGALAADVHWPAGPIGAGSISESLAAVGGAAMTIQISLFGGKIKFDLNPHEMTVEPQDRAQHVGYVQLPGS